MTHLNITITRAQPLAPPAPLPDVTRAEAQSWFSGWWHGLAVGAVTGLALGYLVVSRQIGA